MALLGKRYNSDNTVKTEIRSVEQTSVSKTHKILKSTDTDIPEEVRFSDDEGDLIAGVWEVEGIMHAMVLTFITTLEEVKVSKVSQITQSARSAIDKIDSLQDDFQEQREVFKEMLDQKLIEIDGATTIQQCEIITWNSEEAVDAK